VEGDHRRHALVAQLLQHLSVVLQLRAVELARGRLDPRPLDGEPVRVVTQEPQQAEVLAEPDVVVTGRVGAVPGQDAALAFELPPVAVPVGALDLVRGRGTAPEEALWKAALGTVPCGDLSWMGQVRGRRLRAPALAEARS
jgi:hypothetical protein